MKPLIALTIIICVQCVQGYKILGLFPMTSQSYVNVFNPLMSELARRNHTVTYVTTIKQNLGFSSIRELEVPEFKGFLPGAFRDIMFNPSASDPISQLFKIREPVNEICKVTLKSETFQQLVREGKQYDLVLIHGYMNLCPLMMAHVFAKHVVIMTPGTTAIYLTFPTPIYASFMADKMFNFPQPMNFFHRLQNVFGTTAAGFVFHHLLEWDAETIIRQYYPEAETVDEAQKRVSMVLLNGDLVFQPPHPQTPRILNVGGMHLRAPNPLPKDIADFLEAEDDGFIIFSMGSFTSSNLMPNHVKQAFLAGFSRLKQKVLWKYSEKLDNVPKNVRLMPWLPQQDILGHPKCRLIISHGGLLSLQEAVYHGVPILGVPVFADQPGNVARVKDLGIGEELKDLHQLTPDVVIESVTRILNNSK